jgi:hypothetical protein
MEYELENALEAAAAAAAAAAAMEYEMEDALEDELRNPIGCLTRAAGVMSPPLPSIPLGPKEWTLIDSPTQSGAGEPADFCGTGLDGESPAVTYVDCSKATGDKYPHNSFPNVTG